MGAERVEATIVHPASELAQVSLNDGSGVTVTADHPFYVDASAVRQQPGWVQAGDLRVGDRLRDASGRDVGVVGVRYNVDRAVVYTLSVATDHTFFVGAAQVLVHNAKCGNLDEVISRLSPSNQKSARSLLARIQEHQQKLDAYRADPAAYDNQGLLKNAPSDEIRQRIIAGRVRHLEAEIKAFQNQVAELLIAG